MHQALEITELLRSILQWCDKKTNARNALVCKSWSDVSLDLVWEVITDINVVFGLLGTISTMSDSRRYFAPLPTSREWHRFRSYYACRVRTLNLANLDRAQQERMTMLFDTLARLRYSMPIFPNLGSLIWRDIDLSGYVHHSTLFMHPKITHFRLVIFQPDFLTEINLREYFFAVAEHMPKITKFQVEIPHQSHALFLNPLKAVFKDLANLEHLSLPAISDISDVMKDLSLRTTLCNLEFVRVAREDSIERMVPILCDHAFERLVSLQLHTTYTVLAHFLQETPQFTAKLTNLTVISTSPQSETPSAVKDLLAVIATRFDGSLTCLGVRIDTKFPPDTLESPSIYDVVSFQHIEPVLRCSKMREFRFTHTLPIQLRVNDVEKIASSWPSIVNLHLCADPRTDFLFDKSLDYLSLDSLMPFTKHCPLLETLEIAIDALDPITIDDELSITPLQHLRVFSPGNVAITVKGAQLDYVAVAMVLSRILPPGCEISFRTSWANTSGTEVTPEEWTAKWRDVKRGLVLIEAVRNGMKREVLKTVEGLVKQRLEEK